MSGVGQGSTCRSVGEQLQPGPGHRAGVDLTQLLPDGRGRRVPARSRSSRSRDHTVVSHCGGGGRWVRGEGGREGQGPAGVTGASAAW